MATDFSKIKSVLDVPVWQHLNLVYTAAQALLTSAAGSSLISDIRASQYRNPNVWYLQAAAVLMQYSTVRNGWLQLASPALTGVFGAGAGGVFAPSQGPRGTIASGATTTTLTLTTALPAAVGLNQLKGLRIRVINNTAGANGRTEEKTIVDNTAGTTPLIRLDSALAQAPAVGAAYEIQSGRVFLLSAGTLAAGMWKYFDIATSSYSGNLATTNLPATVSTDCALVCLDELHTPISGVGAVVINGDVGGYFGTLTATASSATTLTGQASAGDASVLANEYRNFQIRVVEDATTPTAAGQRRRITSHTAGASPVYTVPTWTVTPSASAKFVIENNNDIILWSSGVTTTYRYDPIANAWDTSTYAVRPSAMAAGCTVWHPFNRVIDTSKNSRYSYLYSPRGGSSSAIDLFDIAGAATGAWTADIAYDNKGSTLFGAGAGASYDPISNKTLILPLAVASVQPSMCCFDNDLMSLGSYAQIPQINSTAVAGNRVAVEIFVDGTDKKGFAYVIPSTQAMLLRSLIHV